MGDPVVVTGVGFDKVWRLYTGFILLLVEGPLIRICLFS